MTTQTIQSSDAKNQFNADVKSVDGGTIFISAMLIILSLGMLALAGTGIWGATVCTGEKAATGVLLGVVFGALGLGGVVGSSFLLAHAIKHEKRSDSPMHTAIKEGNITDFQKYLKQGGIEKRHVETAIRSGSKEIVDELLNSENEDARGLALHAAVKEGNLEYVNSFLEKYTDGEQVGLKGALMLAAKHHSDSEGKQLESKQRDDIFDAILSKGVNINAQSKEGYTTLAFAAYKSDIYLVQKILEIKDVDVSLSNKPDQSPLQIAMTQKSIPITKAIISSGKVSEKDLNLAEKRAKENCKLFATEEFSFSVLNAISKLKIKSNRK